MSNRIEDQARRIAEPFLNENNCLLWDVLFEKEGAMHYLKVLFDDGDGALDMDKCERLTPPLNKLFDAEDFIKQVDIVEIGSPGLTRRLRHKEHFNFCKGKNIRVMKRLENGKTQMISGTLTDYDAEGKYITLNGEEQMNLKKCIRITLEEQPQ
ncbi:MAG: ribosome assembly cofactor RimP [Oscillospiraceae bacterium]|nr:ribosome assembly cofactor RimP [Oscillospiraceae bacterium]